MPRKPTAAGEGRVEQVFVMKIKTFSWRGGWHIYEVLRRKVQILALFFGKCGLDVIEKMRGLEYFHKRCNHSKGLFRLDKDNRTNPDHIVT